MDSPGLIARVRVIDSTYTKLLTQAQNHFAQFFEPDISWSIIGAEIEPHREDQGFEGTTILSWQGVFYAMPSAPRPVDE